MPNQSRREKVLILFRDRFRHHGEKLRAPDVSSPFLTFAEEIGPRTADEHQAIVYLNELLAMSDGALSASYDVIIQRQIDEYEQRHTFNQHSALADAGICMQFARSAYWTAEEATALLLARNPSVVTLKAVDADNHAVNIRRSYARLYELIDRAQTMGELQRRIRPADLIDWATRLKIEVPPMMKAALEECGIPFVDWKVIADKQDTLIKELEAKITALQEEREARTAREQPAKSLGARERESLLKIVITAAVKKYRHDPKKRSNAVANIATDLRELEIPLDEDTIRKYLSEARDLLPGKSAD